MTMNPWSVKSRWMTDSEFHSSRFQQLDRWLGPVLILLTALVYLPWCTGELIWDDQLLVLENRYTDSLGNWGLFFQMELWSSTPKVVGETGFYRPLVLLDLAIDQALFGAGAVGHRVLTWGWPRVEVSGCLRVCRRLDLPVLTAMIGAFVVAVHPVQSEVVFFVSARNDSMASAWILGALLWLLPDDGRISRSRWLGGAFCTLGAALCKESVLLAPLVFLVLSRWRENRWGAVGLGAMATGMLVYFGLRWTAGVAWPVGASLTDTIRQSPSILAYYSRDILLPWDIGPGLHLLWPPKVPWFMLILGFGVLGLMLYRKRREAWPPLVIWAILMLPAVMAAQATQAPAQRYLYLPMIAIGLIVAVALKGLSPVSLRSVGALGLVLFSGLVGVGAGQWQSDLSLWRHAVARHGGGYVHGAYAKTLEDLGRLEEAGEHYRVATSELSPRFLESCFNVTQVQIHLQRPDLALTYGLAALENGCPRAEELTSPMVVAWALTGDWQQAQIALREQTRDPYGWLTAVELAIAARNQNPEPIFTRHLRSGSSIGTRSTLFCVAEIRSQ